MRAAFMVLALCLGVFILVPPDLSRSSSANALPSPQGPGTIYCASDDGKRNYCQTNVNGGVQLTKQRSQSPCVFGQTWGYDKRGIWVDRGCRAEFSAGFSGGGPGNGGPNWGGWGNAYNIYCASDDMRRNWCPVDTRGGVRLARQRSQSACVWGSTWGYDKKGVWVDRGCRADFEIGQAGWQPDQKQTVYCASDDMRRNFCKANTGQGVRIIRQRSESDCIYNRTWGYDRNGIWVDRGCRADFEISSRY